MEVFANLVRDGWFGVLMMALVWVVHHFGRRR
jgi:hypothetical protein